MVRIKPIIKIISNAISRLMCGEKFNNIVSLCFVEYGNNFHDKKDIDKASKYYEKALKINPDNYYAYSGIAAVFAEKGDFKQALAYCNKAISLKEPDILLLLLLAVIYDSLGENILFKEIQQKILPFFDGNLAAAYNRFSYTYSQMNMKDKAEQYCKEAIMISPTEWGLHNNLANIYLSQGKYGDAREEFQKALDYGAEKKYKRLAIKSIKTIERINLKI